MNPMNTGAARKRAMSGETRKGDTSMSAPAAIGRAGEAGGVAGREGFSLPASPAFPALAIPTSSAHSNIAGQIVANDHAYPNSRRARFSGRPTYIQLRITRL